MTGRRRQQGMAPLDEQGRPLVRARVQGNPKEGQRVYALTIPSHLARALPDEFLDGRFFSVEFTDEGILYRPEQQVKTNALPAAPPPKWAGRKDEEES